MDFYMLGYCEMALVSNSGFGILGILRNRLPNENFFVLSASPNGLEKPKFISLNDFIKANPYRF